MCGRRKLERNHPDLCNWGDMDPHMAFDILNQIPAGAVVQLHNNGEPLLYLWLRDVITAARARGLITSLNTNGKLLWKRRFEVSGLDTLVVSIIQDDPEADEQLDILNRYAEWNGPKPRLILRFLGDVDVEKYAHLLILRDALRVTRTLHDPGGSRKYRKPPPIPEIGICLELLTHLAIDRYGNISICVRFDPAGDLRLGNINEITLEEAIHGEQRKNYIAEHIRGRRDRLPGCDQCDFWGCVVA
jgi:radical SAM protein with 4Fe4S-binding SPASM domain